MSIPKQGARKIVVAAEPFIWLIRKRASDFQAYYPDTYLHVAVEHAVEDGSTLLIITDRLHPAGLNSRSAIIPVIPADVSLWIEQALSLGWLPTAAGKSFEVKVGINCLEKI